MNILQIDDLHKSFRENDVISGLDLSVEENTIYGFIGSNGSGKTTTMKMVLGLLKQDAGQIHVNGEKVTFGHTATNRYIGFLPDVPEFYAYMNAEEYLKLCAEITDIRKSGQKERIDHLLALVGLQGVETRIKTYSRGMKQRLGIAQALINQPKLLICDEPTSALDPKGRREILNILQQIKGETTVIFSTHILTDVERICDKAGILYEGKIRKEIDLKKEALGEKGIVVELMPEEYEVLSGELPLERLDENKYRVTGLPIETVYRLLNTHKIYPDHLVRERKTLEDVYLEVTS
ncbi:ABC transporter ATP-binding protein [Lacicoccus alkaliphilus]|uniref:ABC-2 type transport system ATP-binding protein n=1 Tax=Lacicoccus alkaliphilus DSM 16010 TaxID=1123231 RepID=A0A1M7HLR7_9BACL|nr:ABC transporter ATP-binding protein [Salinicoccus alkaliphilus]SHM29067.1 ABC-2 type transport system ATP-binding protein [Salinicoccus alkaliphilus DSM 16010]